MSFQVPSNVKKYTYPFDVPGAMTGNLPAGTASTSLSQPGGTFPAPRAAPAPQPAGGAAAFAKGMPASQAFASQASPALQPYGIPKGYSAGAALSPYEDQYRGAAQGWEQQRGDLAQSVAALQSPQAWASAGTPEAVWKATQDKQVGQLDNETEGNLAKIDAAYRAGLINSAEARARREKVNSEYEKRRAGILAEIQTQKRTEGRDAAMARANALLSLYGQTPVQSAPSMIPISKNTPQLPNVSVMGGGRGGGGGGTAALNEIAQTGRAAGKSNVNQWLDDGAPGYNGLSDAAKAEVNRLSAQRIQKQSGGAVASY